MTPKQVQRKYKTITGRVSKLNEQLEELRSLCLHPNVDKKYRADTGNWDPHQDSYWIDWHCPDCGRRWRTDQ